MAENEVLSIAVDGDAILSVFDEGQEEIMKIRVDTDALKAASKVFKAMFGPNFAEGQQLDRQTPPEILVQDDPNSIKVICQVLHWQNDSLPESLPAQQVLRLAETVEKYDLCQAMSIAMQQWLVPNGKAEELFILLEAAVLLKNSTGYEVLTRALLFNWTVSYMAAPGFDTFGRLMLRTLLALERAREALRVRISDLIASETLAVATRCSCKMTEADAIDFLKGSEVQTLAPAELANTSVARAIATLNTIKDGKLHREDIRPCEMHWKHRTPVRTRTAFSALIDDLNCTKGLSLREMNLFPTSV